MKKAYLVCILSCILFSVNAYAQIWQPLGPTDTNQASFGEADFQSIVVGSNGVPYIAFGDEINNYLLSVRKYENGTWSYVGAPAFSTARVHTPCLAIDGNNTPYVFYMEQGSTVGTVKKFNGSTWEIVGSAADLTTGGAAQDINLAIDATNTPYVLYSDVNNSNLITVKRFDGSAWTNVGTPGFAAGSISDIALSINNANTPYVAYQDPASAQKLTVKKFNGSAWVTVGTAGFSTGSVSNVSMAISPASNAPYVAYLDENHIAKVIRFNGSFWQSYGTPSTDWTEFLCLAVDANGWPYVAYYDISNNNALVKKWSLGSWVNVGTAVGNRYVGKVAITTDVNRDPYIVYSGSFMHNKAVVNKFDGSNWVNLGTTGFSPWAVDHTVIKLDGSNTPYVAYVDFSNERITVKKYNGGSWVTVGTEGFTVAESKSPDMAFDATGAPYVVYRDVANSNKATVQKFNGSTWDFVGTPGFSDRIASYAHIAIDGNNTPYVVYQDAPTNSANNKIVVKKFDGTNWVSVGTDGFSAGRVKYTDVAIHGDGTPYVAYQDWGNSRKLTVKKFNGSSWVTVGTEGFSTGSDEDIDIAFDGNNTLYLAYVNVSGNDLIPVVKKFDGNTWVDVGTVSTTGGYNISLAFNAIGTPYVAYTDEANNEKATVKKFDGSTWVDVGSQGFSAGRAESPSIAIGSNGNVIVVYGSGDAFAQTIIESTLGKVNQSRIVALPVNQQAGTVVLYGNPVHDEAKFTVTVGKQQPVQVRLIDNIGMVIRSQQWNVSAGSTSLSIDMTGIPKGIYYLYITGNSINKHISLLKQ